MLSILQERAIDKRVFLKTRAEDKIKKINKRVHIFISGRVQGVLFRAHTQKRAQGFGLFGWVRNLPDGRVEIVAEGEEAAISSLIEWAHRGPPAARVENLQVEWSSPQGEREFHIVYR